MPLGDPYTASMSNAVSLSLGDVTALLDGASLGSLPITDARLRLFLHESTHHTSFSNAYGWATAGLESSVISPGLVGPLPQSPDDLLLPERDLLVLRWTQRVFQPLLEGLAVFAEHDIGWSASSCQSQPLLDASSLYLARDAFSSVASAVFSGPLDEAGWKRAVSDLGAVVGDSIDSRLKKARSSRRWVAEKENLLRQPLMGSMGGAPYLLGYLAVKRAFLKVRHGEPARSDPDGFLLLMLHHWFCDENLARAMLDVNDVDPIRVQLTLGAIEERVQDRWEQLYRSPRSAAASAMASLVHRGGVSAQPPFDLQFLLGIRALQFSLPTRAPRFFKHRLVLRHGALSVGLRVNDDARTASVLPSKGGPALFQCPLVRNADVNARSGTIELVRSGDRRFDALLVLGGDGLVAAWDQRERVWNSPDLVEVFDDLPSSEQALDAELAVQNTRWEETWNSPGLAGLYEHQVAQAAELCGSTYLQIAFPGAKSGERKRISSVLGERGFADLFNEPGALSKLARYSLAFGGRGAPVGEVAAATGTTPKILLEEVGAINSRARFVLGVDLFEESAGAWLTSAV